MEIIDQFSVEEEETGGVTTIDSDLPIPPSFSPSRSKSQSSPSIHEEKMMTVSRLREALVFADPDNQRAGVNKLLARACAVGTEEMLVLESKRTKFSVEFFKNNKDRNIYT